VCNGKVAADRHLVTAHDVGMGCQGACADSRFNYTSTMG
jgi:hypothetical protein